MRRYFGAHAVFHVAAPAGLRLVGFRHAQISSAEARRSLARLGMVGGGHCSLRGTLVRCCSALQVEHLLVEWFLFGMATDAVVTFGSSLAISSFLRSNPHAMPFYILPVDLIPAEINDQAAQSCIRRSFAPGRACYMGNIVLWGLPKLQQH